MSITPNSTVRQVLHDPAARAVLRRRAPELLQSPYLADLAGLPVRVLVDPPALFGRTGVAGVDDPEVRSAIWGELGSVDREHRIDDAAPARPASGYEAPSVGRGSATAAFPSSCDRWRIFEIAIDGPDHGNPYVDVELTARFESSTHSVSVGGFYDGDGRYLIRFMPPTLDRWTFRTRSNARSLDGLEGSFTSTPGSPDVHGPVRVSDGFHFAHADGTRFVPVGTTAYAWTHQDESVQARTLATLAGTPFNKLRMCVLPKSFMYNENEPPRYPFPGSVEDGWDTERFNPDFFRHLEGRIAELADLGIEVDLILLHPYDRWGFSTLSHAAHQRLVRYVVRRLAAHRNVWWSMANEYDLLPTYTTQDWEELAQVVVDNDPVGHLLSIHNWIDVYDHSRPWITHCSIQATDVLTAEHTDVMRTRWNKPVILDECGYEGDIDQGWGNLTAQEFVHRSWAAAVRGGYVSHGETYVNDRDELFWSKGGDLVGESPSRIAFLARILAESPTGKIDPVPLGPFNWDVPYAGVPDRYYLAYLGASQPRYRNVRLPEGQHYRVDVVDTWNMTCTRLDGTYTGTFRVELPARPFLALRMIRVD